MTYNDNNPYLHVYIMVATSFFTGVFFRVFPRGCAISGGSGGSGGTGTGSGVSSCCGCGC